MAEAPDQGDKSLLRLEFLLAGKQAPDEFPVIAIEVERVINKIARAKIILSDGQPSKRTFTASESDYFMPGKVVEIRVGYEAGLDTVFKGIILKHKITSRLSGRSQLELHCADEAVAMTKARHNKYFKEESDSSVISKICKAYKVKAKVDSTSYKYPEIIQYYASDWDFILSRAELNGLVVATNDGDLLVKKPDTSAKPVLTVTYGVNMLDFDAELDAEPQTQNVSCKAWDAKTQKMLKEQSSEPSINKQGNLNGKKLAEVLKIKDYELQSSVPLPKSVLKSWANAELQRKRLASIKGFVEFKGNAKPEINATIELDGLGDRFNGIAYITEVHHRIADNNWISSVKFGLSEIRYAEKQAHISAPLAAGLLPGIQGLHHGTVKKIDEDPNGENRILVHIPIIESTQSGVWARMAHFYATNEGGSFFLPEVGDEVILGFIDNDPSHPVILGMLYSTKNKAPFKPEKKNKTKAIITKAKLELCFDDDEKSITIKTPGGNTFKMDDKAKSIECLDSNNNKITLDQSGISIEASKDLILKAKGNINISSTANLKLDAKADVSVEALNIKQAAKVSFNAEGKASANLSASGQTTVRGALVQIN